MQLKRICKKYIVEPNKRVEVLSDVSISFPKKGMVFIVGEHGCGKTTLLKIIAGLIKPSSGELIVSGRTTSDFTSDDWADYRSSEMGLALQESPLISRMSVEKNILLPLQLQGSTNGKKILDALKEVGLEGFEKEIVSSLTADQKQRVIIARALIKGSSLIIADEPTEAMKTGERQIFNLLKRISREKLVIVATSHRELADQFADGIIELSSGHVSLNNLASSKEEEAASLNKKTHSRLRFKETFKWAANCFKSNPVKLTIALLISCFSFGLFGVFDTMAAFDSSDLDRTAANSLITGEDKFLAVQKLAARLSDEDLVSLEDKTGLAFDGVVEADRVFIDRFFLNKPESYHDDYSSLNTAISTFLPLTAETKLPSSYKLLSGAYPSKNTDIVLTDYQYSLFKVFGYQDSTVENGETIAPERMDDQSLIGKKLFTSYRHDLTITGILDTEFEMEHFKPYFDALKSDEVFDPLTWTGELKRLYDELQNLEQYSYVNIGFVSDAMVRELKDLVNSFGIFPAKYNTSALVSTETPDIAILMDHTGVQSSLSSKYSVYFDDSKTSLEDDELMLPIARYISALSSESFMQDTLPIIIKKEFIYGATSDQTIEVSPEDFFSDSLTSYGIDYVVEESYADAITNKRFDFAGYAVKYYEGLNVVAPNPIPEEDKKEIFRYFVKENYRLNVYDNESFISVLNQKALSVNCRLLASIVEEYADSIFRYRDFIIGQHTSGLRGENSSPSVHAMKLVGFTLGDCSLLSEPTARVLFEEVGNIYSRGILPMTDDQGAVVKLVVNDLGISIINLHLEASSFFSRVKAYRNTFLAVSIILAVFSAGLLLNLMYSYTEDKKIEIRTLRALGTRKSSIFKVFAMNAAIIAAMCFALSMLVLFVGGFFVNLYFMNSFNLAFPAIMPGIRQVGVTAVATILITFAGTIWPIITVCKD